MAGIIGACGNNTIGVTGVMQQVKLVSIRVIDSSGHISDSDIESAIDYASYCNIKVINLSLGGPDQLLGTKRAIEHYSGLVVCAAGNDNQDNDSNNHFPSNYNYNNLISVGAIKSDGSKYELSNYGATTVDIFAPGSSILSTFPTDICSSLNHIFSDSTHLCELDRDCAYFLQDLVDSGTATWANIEANFSTLAW